MRCRPTGATFTLTFSDSKYSLHNDLNSEPSSKVIDLGTLTIPRVKIFLNAFTTAILSFDFSGSKSHFFV
jgi:hypothetical protein